jgi:hypothetical protein
MFQYARRRNVWSAALSQAKNDGDGLVCANVFALYPKVSPKRRNRVTQLTAQCDAFRKTITHSVIFQFQTIAHLANGFPRTEEAERTDSAVSHSPTAGEAGQLR